MRLSDGQLVSASHFIHNNSNRGQTSANNSKYSKYSLWPSKKNKIYVQTEEEEEFKHLISSSSCRPQWMIMMILS